MNKASTVLSVVALASLANGVPNLATTKIQIQALFPYYEFTMNMANDTATVMQFLPSGTSPHDWESSIRQVEVLAEGTNAQILKLNHLGGISNEEFNSYIDKMVENLTVLEVALDCN